MTVKNPPPQSLVCQGKKKCPFKSICYSNERVREANQFSYGVSKYLIFFKKWGKIHLKDNSYILMKLRLYKVFLETIKILSPYDKISTKYVLAWWILSIQLSHMPPPNTRGRLFWITCNQLKLLRKPSCLPVIQNSAPSVVWWRNLTSEWVQICNLHLNCSCQLRK